MIFYSALLAFGLAVSSPWWLYRMVTSDRYRAGLQARLGRVPPDLAHALAGTAVQRRVVWLHAVSVGEFLAVERLLTELARALPLWTVAISTTTVTGFALARQRFPELPVFFYPLDFAFSVRPYLRTLNPALLILVESEFWPRMLVECRRNRIPVAVVNARISDRSFPRYLRLRRFWRPFLQGIAIFLAQGAETATRLKALGVSAGKIEVTGNLKSDWTAVLLTSKVKELQALLGDQELLICGSTAEGEEQLILRAWPLVRQAMPNAGLLLAPRHPERSESVAELVEAAGFTCVRATLFSEAVRNLSARSIFLLDTVGDLASAYSLASAAFVGGSLVPRGGQNPLEPARLGVPTLMGPHRENFREISEVLLAEGRLRLTSEETFAEDLVAGLRSPRFRPMEAPATDASPTGRTLEALLTLLSEPRS